MGQSGLNRCLNYEMLFQGRHVRSLSRHLLPVGIKKVARCSANGGDKVGRAMRAAAVFEIFKELRHVEDGVSGVDPHPI